ncbi:MAG TPA: endolytic transglycosylase MltG [Xanthobacteraceae bacterium]|jgi:UPF0755 protein|nr:endolytic transglycosylase MltG [Xanthobacteraceae bacterium]
MSDTKPADDRASENPERDPKRVAPRSPRAALEPEHVAQLYRPSKRARHPVVVAGSAFFTFILLIVLVAGFGFAFGKQQFEAAGPLGNDRTVNIPRGGIRDIAELLQREGVIDQPWIFIGGVLVLKAKDELKAGEYEFKKQASLHDVVNTLIENKQVKHQITVPEGLTSEQIVARLMESDVLAGNIRDIPREGTLLPETYQYNRGMTREQIIARMQQEQRRIVQEIWERRAPDLPIKTPEQLVILASIVEKETGKNSERSRVAAVFVNRLKLHMKLQSDPTIIYGLVGGKGTLGRPIMRSEIDQPTPYNTYAIDGLPPGPIANPGRAALEATANPARTKELFFVADGTGGHSFSENLEQHQKSVGKLRQLEQQQREATQGTQDSQATPTTLRSLAPTTGNARTAPLARPAVNGARPNAAAGNASTAQRPAPKQQATPPQ